MRPWYIPWEYGLSSIPVNEKCQSNKLLCGPNLIPHSKDDDELNGTSNVNPCDFISRNSANIRRLPNESDDDVDDDVDDGDFAAVNTTNENKRRVVYNKKIFIL